MTAFTLFHVALSLVGIAAGFLVVLGFLAGKRFSAWTATFLVATILTSVTGFLFPIERFTPGHAVGILSLVALGLAVVARYPMQMAGRWRATYVLAAIASQYFNFAVLIIQSFQKVPSLQALASTPAEAITQLTTLVLFIALAVASVIRFRPNVMPNREESHAAVGTY
jgi:hypothetical protein